MKSNMTTKISNHEIMEAITNLNSGKAADIHGMCSEHIKKTAPVICNTLCTIYNNIIASGVLPQPLREAYILPTHKKGSDPLIRDNYRGISITPVIMKTLEHVMLKHIEPTLQENDLQFGFTKGTSPLLSSLLVTEAIAESKDNKLPIHIVALDVRKAFDVVNHNSLLRKLFNQQIDTKFWPIIKQSLEVTSRVKINSTLGESFSVTQGVGQGTILSTKNYKAYINDLIDELTSANIGLHIGDMCIASPYCADDSILLSNTIVDIQTQLYISEEYAERERYAIHPTKSQCISFGAPHCSVELSGKNVPCTEQITHLGITRHRDSHGNLTLDPFIEEKISSSSRVAYALMGAGFHG